MTRRSWRWALLVAALAAAALVVGPEAWARVGGGQSYGGSHSSRSSGGSDGGGDLGLVLFLIQLVIEVPALGIPLVIIVAVVFVMQARSGRVKARAPRAVGVVSAVSRAAPGLADLRQRDPAFSMPAFLDFVVMVHRRTLEAVEDRAHDEVLAPFVDPAALTQVRGRLAKVAAVTEVVCGAVRVLKVERGDAGDRVYVRLETTRVERGADGKQRRFTIEDWVTLRRGPDAKSLAPERIEAMGCPSCGAPIEVTALGACAQCGTGITKGQLQWQLTYWEERSRKAVTGPMLALGPGGDEPGVLLPVVTSPSLDADLRALAGFDGGRFRERVKTTYLELQSAWTEGRWQRARPFVTDRLFQTLRFWMEQYSEVKLRNVLEDVELLESRPVEASSDPYFQSVTVRIVGRMRDSTVNEAGKVVSGNAKVARRFAEYWTFVRSVEAPPDKDTDGARCPSCGAPLDRVDETGVCGYCSAKITSGRFDWVLSRIEQPQAYR